MKSVSQREIVYSLLFGSSHTTLIAAHIARSVDGERANLALRNPLQEENRFQIVGSARVSNHGAIKKGIVSGIDALTHSILESVDELERQVGFEVTSVNCGISGPQVFFENHLEKIKIEKAEIEEKDLEKLNQCARFLPVPENYECIHMIPGMYSVDDRHGIHNPIGMMGKELSLMFHRVFFPKADLHSILKSCHNSGLHINKFIYMPIAAAEGSLSYEEKEYGCVSICIGSQLTHIAIYFANVPIYTKVIPVGSHHITRDISIGLHTTHSEAERIKKELGRASEISFKELNEKVDISGVDGIEAKMVTRGEIIKIIESRVREIFETIFIELKRMKLLGKMTRGAVISGGGSLLNGISIVAEESLGMHVRVANPTHVAGAIEGLKSPIWCSGIGSFSNLFLLDAVSELKSSQDNHLKSQTLVSKLWFKLRESFLTK